MNAAIRPARAEDAAAAAALIYSSGPEAFEYVFSHRARTPARGFIAYAFSRDAGEFSWRWFRVVEVDGQVAGTASGYTGADARGFAWHAVRQIIHCNGLAAGARVIARGLRIERIIVPPSRPDEYYIGNVAIAPDLRSRGLGRMIFEHLHEEARARGASECVLDVSAENPRAEALYARLGYQVVRDIPSRLANAAGRVPDHRRMALSL